jgi:hypothetical protein
MAPIFSSSSYSNTDLTDPTTVLTQNGAQPERIISVLVVRSEDTWRPG